MLAYNPATGTSGVQTVQQVWINHDTDLVDVTLRVVAPATGSTARRARAPLEGEPAGRAPPPTTAATKPATSTHDETVHTTANHPWLTADAGWKVAGTLAVGELVQRVDGSTAVVVAVRVVPGVAAMWDLTVSQVHTFAVGDDAYVVHNCGDPEGQVKWGETDLSNQVKGVRKDPPVDVDHNYAAARLDNGEVWVTHSTGDLHAEESLVDDAEENGRTIVALYSERQPCPAKCANYLLDHNPDMKISWTWPWTGENPALSREIQDFLRDALK